MMTEAGYRMLKRHEGLRLNAYLCPAGKLTIGFGHTHGVNPDMEITNEDADRLLHEDVASAEWDARKLLPNFDVLSPNRQDAIVNMAFNLGYPSLLKFKTFLRAMKAGEWTVAGTSLKTTLWYRQVQTRAKDIVQLILQG